MQSKLEKNIILIRLFEDEDIINQIKNACRTHNVKTAIVLSGIGQIKQVSIGYFKEKGNYDPKTYNKPLEILSLSGNICKQKNDYFLHLHIVLGDEEKKAFGGHLIEGKISVTGEIILLKTQIDIKRKLDKKTGLKALYLE
jgi:predicted DNA-binding protein with PD1-like motif